MARDGIFRRIGRAIRNVIAPSPPPRPQPPEQPKPEPRGDPYRDVWKQKKRPKRASYQKNLKVFHAVVDPIESDPSEQLGLWQSFVDNIVEPKGRERRQSTSNMFWRDSGIDPNTSPTSGGFNWAAWREAMGYTGKHRSRTP
jgi:hypothetical protein